MDGYFAQLQRGIDHIEAHLDEPFALMDVSGAACISHWHFQRIFRAVTGETLMAYVRARRLATAEQSLLTTDARIIDIALRAGFSTQESFTRAFKQAFGLAPGEYRSLGKSRRFVHKLQLDGDYLRHLQHHVTLEPVLAERSAERVVGLSSHFYGVDSDKDNMAARIPPLWGAFLPRLGDFSDPAPTICYGVISAQPGDEALSYLACAASAGPAPLDMEVLTVPGGTYATFEHRGPIVGLDRTVNYIYAAWLPNSGWRHTYGPDLEIYDDRYEASSPHSVIQYAIPIAKH